MLLQRSGSAVHSQLSLWSGLGLGLRVGFGLCAVGFDLGMVGSFRYLRFLLERGFSSFTTVGASLMG